jgi:hypothetical protein
VAISRRTILKGAGIAAVVASGGVLWRASDQHLFSPAQGVPYEPWHSWNPPQASGLLRLVHAAVLAANPHNTQPWLFHVTDSRIDLFADLTRHIGAIDPFLREMYVGVGCALENALLAAAVHGYRAQVALLPDPANPTLAARIDLSTGVATPSALFDAIPHRHTNRGPYEPARPVSAHTLAQLAALISDIPRVRVRWYAQAPERAAFGELIVQATKAIIADRQQAADSARWFRDSWQAIEKHRDGITLDAQGLPPFINVMAKVLPAPGQDTADQMWLKATRESQVETAAAFGLLAVHDSGDNVQRLLGGRAWQRMHLWGTTQGLGMQPLNQLPERADRERQLGIEPRFGHALKALLGDEGGQVLMPFRLGYPTRVGLPSPRRPVPSVLV